jgi:hypothetical protein
LSKQLIVERLADTIEHTASARTGSLGFYTHGTGIDAYMGPSLVDTKDRSVIREIMLKDTADGELTNVANVAAALEPPDQVCSPKRDSNSRRPRSLTRNARLSRSSATHFLLSANRSSAAPNAPPTCERRSLQSRHANANFRRDNRAASTSTPSAASASAPDDVSSYDSSLPVERMLSQPIAANLS